MSLIDTFNDLGYEPIPTPLGFKICCPFHEEDTPSFSVDESMGRFHCFGCGKSGSITELLNEFNLSTISEVDLLFLKKTKVLNTIADALSEFTLYPTKAKPIKQSHREITPETFNIFSAYTLDNHESIYFPCYFRGKNRGIIEKVLGGKYINHFTNGYIPFNIDRVNSSSIILVEGVFDLLSVYQAGFPNVMASLSSSYSFALIKWLKQINAVNLYILYDGDDAGEKGAKNLHIRYPDSHIIKMPDGLDPNELSNLEDFLLYNGVPR